jgi:hypothetical protein
MSSDFIWWAVGVIGTTMAVAHAEGTTLPYWPIEISRTATGRWSRYVFLAGFILLVTSGKFPLQTAAQRVAAAGLLLLAAVPDTVHWHLHMAGVATLVGACLSTGSLMASVGVGVYALRAVLRNVAVMLFEMSATVPASLNKALAAMDIVDALLFGRRSFRDARTLLCFRLAGVAQWLALLLLVQGVL